MANEIVILNRQENDTVRVGFLFPLPAPRVLTRAAGDGVTLTAPAPDLARIVPPTTASAGITADTVYLHSLPSSPSIGQPPEKIDPILDGLITDRERGAIAAGVLAYTIVVFTIEPGMTTPQIVAALKVMYGQGVTYLTSLYTKRGQYLGTRINYP